MHLVATILSILLALMCLGSAVGKLTQVPAVRQNLSSVGLTEPQQRLLAVPLVLGAAGLLVGLQEDAVGIAAAVGLVAYFVLAVASHTRARVGNYAPPGLYLVLSVATLVVLLLD